MTAFAHTAVDIVSGLWWLWAFVAVFLAASLFVAGLCAAAGRPMPKQEVKS